MKTQIIFEDGKLAVHITAITDAEKLILGTLNGEGGASDIQTVIYANSPAHFTYGKYDSVRIVLTKRSEE